MKREFIGIDFGSTNTKIYSSMTGEVIFNEPTCLVMNTLTSEVREIGFLASKVMGKTPYHFDMVYPVDRGYISDIDASVQYLSSVLSGMRFDKNIRGLALVFSCPSKCSKVNRNAIVEIGKKLQAKEIFLEPQAKLAALGSKETVYSPSATLVCNIGYGITDIACLSMGEVVSSDTTFISGSTFDEAIRRYLVQEKHLEIGKTSAERIKMRIGTVSKMNATQLSDVKGRDTMTSLPSSSVISSDEIRKVLLPHVNFIALKISDVIARVNPELASDLVNSGLILTGGSAMLSGMKEYLESILGIPVRVAKDPGDSVIKGIENYIQHIQ